MAFAVTARHSGTNGASAAQTVASTNNPTPSANSLLLVGQAAGWTQQSSVDANMSVSPTGGSLTYTAVATAANGWTWGATGGYNQVAKLWRADVGGSPSAFNVTCDNDAGTGTWYGAMLSCDVTGHNSSTPVQSKTNGAGVNPASDTASATVTFDSALTSGNLVVLFLASQNDTASTHATPTIGGQNMTALGSTYTGTAQHDSMWYRVIDGSESNATITCSDLGTQTGNWAAVAVEIAAPPAGQPASKRLGGVPFAGLGKGVW